MHAPRPLMIPPPFWRPRRRVVISRIADDGCTPHSMHKSCNMTIGFRQRRADSKGTDSKGFGGGIEQNDRPAEGKNASRLAVRWSRLRNHSADMGRLKIARLQTRYDVVYWPRLKCRRMLTIFFSNWQAERLMSGFAEGIDRANPHFSLPCLTTTWPIQSGSCG